MTAGLNMCKQPVVAIVGHIDHGKTSLLDYIRKSRVAADEVGGITQRISAYEIEHVTKEQEARAITFIDTPGHEAFQKMRRRGAGAADIAILIVAADDGVKPQTKEAWAAIQDAKIPMIVAFTKIDKETANIDRAKDTVLKEGIYLEGLGGEIPWVGVSSKDGTGVQDLLDLIVLAADLNGVTCDAGAAPRAIVIESSRDPRTGVSATVIVRDGTFATGGFAVTQGAWAPIRVIETASGEKVKEIACGKPARLTGFSSEPAVGAEISVVGTKKEAEKHAADTSTRPPDAVASTGEAEEKTPIRLMLKADTAGSLEALQYELGKVPHEHANLIITEAAVGPLSEADVKHLIGFENAVILGFNIKVEAGARDLAERQGITIETREIIYELTDWLTEKVKELAPGIVVPPILARVKVLKHFSSAGVKHVIGGAVEEGTLKRGNSLHIIRRDIEVGRGKVINLQSQKADVSEVATGAEFGAQIESKADLVPGDVLEVRPDTHK